jgi:hypothetical protein
MFTSRKALDRRHSKDLTGEPEDSGVSVSIYWRRGGWMLAALIAAIVVARVLASSSAVRP